MISVNQRAAAIVQEMMADAEALGLSVSTLANGATVVDAGVKAPGSLGAGKLFAEACLGGLGQVDFIRLDFFPSPSGRGVGGEGFWLPGVGVSVSHPSIACMASQYAGWAIKREKFFAMGSGPARALYAGEELFARLGYKDVADVAVLLLEGRKLPNEEVVAYVAGKCGKEAWPAADDPSTAIVQVYLTILAHVPDTLIARKRGGDVACQVSRWAEEVLAVGGVFTTQGRKALEELDHALRDERHTLNPGTTADLTTAAIFLVLLHEM